MQQYPLLQTKVIMPPIRPELVSRPRLIERLNAGVGRRLTIISAPAGFGKTTLVSDWAQALGSVTQPTAVAWLSLDESDNDPTRFLAYMTTALQTIEATMGKAVLSALQSPQSPPVEAILTSLINEIVAIRDRIILVLDDYHLIEAQPIHYALAFLLQHLPPPPGGLHLVIATRDDPHLPLARLRARSQLTELRASDLRFTSSEAAEFLNRVMGQDLSPHDIAALENRTEGWIAGLQMAALSMQGRTDAASFIESFTGSHRYVLDYLVEEVLEQQSSSLQAFLLQTSVLDRLTGSLCDALTGQDNGQATLETLERANLFVVPLDEERRWYRYHRLFADLLRQRLRQRKAGSEPALHHRAGEWYQQHGYADEAIEHALCAGDLEGAATVIEVHVEAIWQRGEHTRLRRWLAELPPYLVSTKPHLRILHAWDLFTSGQQDAAERYLQAAESALDSGTNSGSGLAPQEGDALSAFDRMRIRGRAAALRAFLAFYRGDAQATYEHSHRALELLPEQDLTWRSTATVALGDAYSLVGDLAASFRVRSEALQASKAAGNVYMHLIASMKLAVTLRHQGQLQRSSKSASSNCELLRTAGLPGQWSSAGCWPFGERFWLKSMTWMAPSTGRRAV